MTPEDVPLYVDDVQTPDLLRGDTGKIEQLAVEQMGRHRIGERARNGFQPSRMRDDPTPAACP